MKKLLSIRYSETGFNLATLMLRVPLGILMCLNHGITKLSHFSELQQTFFDPLHIGHRWSLILSLFAEVFASILIVLGLFSRIAAFILCVDLIVAIFWFHRGQPLKNMEEAILFCSGFLCILLIGPGKYSVDGMTGN